jgi:hypothetical protein
MDKRLKDFLELVPYANWRSPPKAWGEQVREALSERLITIGFGGSIKLTDAGRLALTNGDGEPR